MVIRVGSFGHLEFAQQHRAGRFKFLDDRGVIVKALLSVRSRAPTRGIAFYSKQVFGCVRNAVQRAAILPCSDFFFRGVRLLQRQIRRERGIGVQFFADGAASIKIAFCEFDG